MANIMMQLGSFQFSLDTAAYQTLKRSSQYLWASTARVGQRPALQSVGLGIETIGINGVIYPHYAGGMGQVDAMRGEASKGEPLMLVDGHGRIWQHWCITSIEETQTTFDTNGTPLKIEFRLQLTRHGED
jgi:phage protein U